MPDGDGGATRRPTAGEAGDMTVTEGDEAGGIAAAAAAAPPAAAAAGQQQGGGSAWRGADESLGALVAEAPPVPPRLLALARAAAAAAVVRAEGAEAQVATLRAHIYRLAACEQARRALDDASAGAEHEESDGDASG